MTAKIPSLPSKAALFDELLVVLIQAGDRAAGEQLARRWLPRLARAAQRLVAHSQSEDAAQETMMAILRGIASLRDPSSFAPWAFSILRRICADIHRKAPPAGEVLDDIAVPAPPQAPLDRLAIASAMAELPPEQRFAAHLFFIEGLALAEIATAQGVPIGTAKSRIFHARRHLKAALSGDDT